MSHRPLVFVSGLTLGDYLLWNWSLNANHDVLALVSGLTLPPLAVIALWMLALSIARLIGYTARLPRQRARRARARASTRPRSTRSAPAQEAPSPQTGTAPPSRKIAA
ncbi:MAG: hypothetical protein ACYDHN_16695 [Solirubrobacteraceae bacterium]